jgi:hypothetical protein
MEPCGALRAALLPAAGFKTELGVPVRQVSREVVVEVAERGDELIYEAPDWPEAEAEPGQELEPAPEPAREPKHGPERDGPDIEW